MVTMYNKIEKLSIYQPNFEKINYVIEEIKTDISKEKRYELQRKLTEILFDLENIENTEYTKCLENQIVRLSCKIEEKFEDSAISHIVDKAFDLDFLLEKGDLEGARQLASNLKENIQSLLNERRPSPRNNLIILVVESLTTQVTVREDGEENPLNRTELMKLLEELIAEELEPTLLDQIFAEELEIEEILSLEQIEIARYRKISSRQLPRYAKKCLRVSTAIFAEIGEFFL